jgi:multiple sugar transport system substrate-binding protein/arabinosaccharide transport system substrate-binding protein
MTPGSPTLSRRGLFRLAAGAGGLALLAGLAGCAPRSASPLASGTVDLSFWTHDDAYVRFFTEAVPLAEKASAFRYDLDLTKAGAADIVTKLIAQAVAGTGTPDVVGLEIGAFTRTLRGSIASELLTDLTDIVAPFGDDLMSARTAPFSKDGRLYALDSDTPMTVYYHRGDEFERLGLPETFDTWDEFLASGEALASAEGISLGAVATNDPAVPSRRSTSTSSSAAAASSTPPASPRSRRPKRRTRCGCSRPVYSPVRSPQSPTCTDPVCRAA